MAEILAAPRSVLGLLILDLDGTLIDSFADIRAGVAAALAVLNVEPEPRLLDLCRLGAPLETFYFHAVHRDPEAAAERQRFGDFVDAYRRYYSAHQEHTQVFPHVARTLETVRRTRPGLRMAVGTGKRTDMARVLLERFGLGGYFDMIQGSEDVAKKPDPALLRLIATALDVSLDGERAMMVGDTGADVGAAHAAGCTSVAVSYGGYTRAELEQLAPHHIIDSFEQLLELI